ncbi:hypothetical protein SAMN05518863_107171 [Candidatus Pantoea symbiotica]|uniref:Uncharacterized protein n=1 Tax=Candidatus Pantoea symbiotica TaxID=1884370 RepID=A0A1I3ZT05_9GAMM|nr:hypothetical protein SAMN05518863_107171 [Pantoea symbiotica]SFU92024.1 hypothetical protein SAMN05518864_107154 [Pantoea sp. YR525]
MNAHPTKTTTYIRTIGIYGDQVRMNAHPTKTALYIRRVAIHGDRSITYNSKQQFRKRKSRA